MRELPVAVYRGGTSRALFFHQEDLPGSIEEQDKVILRAFGSGHQLQIDGLGGGNPLTSKCAIIGPPSVPGADVDYTFGYPGVVQRIVDRKGNCGNISSAVGPFAVDEELVPAPGKEATVVIHNTNTRALLRASFSVSEGRFFPQGDFAIDGVPGTGSRILVEFLGDPTEPLLPTGRVRETLRASGFPGEIEVSILRAGNLTVFCTMEALGIKGDPNTWEGDEELWRRMEAVRGVAAVRLGMAESPEQAQRETPAVPKIVAIRPPQAYVDLQGRQQSDESHQFTALMAAMGVMHRSMAITASVAAAAAAVLPGTLVHELRNGTGPEVIIGHASGKLDLHAELSQDESTWKVKKVGVGRTARRIMKGTLFV